jgi:hypothetical protein
MSSRAGALILATIAVAWAIIASNKAIINEKLAEMLCKKGETMDCAFLMFPNPSFCA